MHSKQTLPLVHNYRPSSLSEKAPAIIMLHGYGSNEDDLFSFAPELPDKYAVIALKAPLSLQGMGNAWYTIHFQNADNTKFNDIEEAVIARELVAETIDEAIEIYNLDPENITLLGFSQGTILSLAVGLSYPEKINRIVALSGYLAKDMLVDDYETKDYTHLDIFQSHGTADMVIPVQWARDAQEALKAMNIKTVYKEYPVGHGVAPQNFYDFRKWLD